MAKPRNLRQRRYGPIGQMEYGVGYPVGGEPGMPPQPPRSRSQPYREDPDLGRYMGYMYDMARHRLRGKAQGELRDRMRDFRREGWEHDRAEELERRRYEIELNRQEEIKAKKDELSGILTSTMVGEIERSQKDGRPTSHLSSSFSDFEGRMNEAYEDGPSREDAVRMIRDLRSLNDKYRKFLDDDAISDSEKTLPLQRIAAKILNIRNAIGEDHTGLLSENQPTPEDVQFRNHSVDVLRINGNGQVARTHIPYADYRDDQESDSNTIAVGTASAPGENTGKSEATGFPSGLTVIQPEYLEGASQQVLQGVYHLQRIANNPDARGEETTEQQNAIKLAREWKDTKEFESISSDGSNKAAIDRIDNSWEEWLNPERPWDKQGNFRPFDLVDGEFVDSDYIHKLQFSTAVQEYIKSGRHLEPGDELIDRQYSAEFISKARDIFNRDKRRRTNEGVELFVSSSRGGIPYLHGVGHDDRINFLNRHFGKEQQSQDTPSEEPAQATTPPVLPLGVPLGGDPAYSGESQLPPGYQPQQPTSDSSPRPEHYKSSDFDGEQLNRDFRDGLDSEDLGSLRERIENAVPELTKIQQLYGNDSTKVGHGFFHALPDDLQEYVRNVTTAAMKLKESQSGEEAQGISRDPDVDTEGLQGPAGGQPPASTPVYTSGFSSNLGELDTSNEEDMEYYLDRTKVKVRGRGLSDTRRGRKILALTADYLMGLNAEDYRAWVEGDVEPLINPKGSPEDRRKALDYADLIDTSSVWKKGRNPRTREEFMNAWEGWRKKLKALGMNDNNDALKISRKAVAQKDEQSFEKWEAGVKGALKRFGEGKGWWP